MRTNCFKNIVSLKGCNTEQPYGGFIDDVYINKANLATAIDGICTVNEWFDMKLQEVVQNLIMDLKMRLEIDVKTIVQVLKSGISISQADGLYLKTEGNSYISITISGIRGVEYPVEFTVNCETYEFTGEPMTFTGKDLELRVEDAEKHSLYDDNCCKPCNVTCSMEYSRSDGGFVFEACLMCDFEAWLCQFKDVLIPLIKDLMRIEVASAMVSSSMVNVGTFTNEEAEYVIERKERNYNRNLKSVLKMIREKAHDECCFECSRFSHGVFQP